MRFAPSLLVNQPVKLTGSLVGVHAILKPDADRIIALLIVEGYEMYTLYVRQANDEEIEIAAEKAPLTPPRDHPAGRHREARSQ